MILNEGHTEAFCCTANGNAPLTPPQSGSGRKEQIRSKAAIRNCTNSFAQRVQYRFRRG